MSAGTFIAPTPVNEPVRAFAPGSAERAEVVAELSRQQFVVEEIPCVIGGRHVFTGRTVDVTNPSAHGEVLARVHLAGPAEVQAAIDASLAA